VANNFKDKHAIITGGSSGIGKATAIMLAAEGAHISIIARDPARLSAAKAEIERARASETQRVGAYTADVSVSADIQRVIVAAIADNGAPDILITSAGMVEPGPMQDQPVEYYERSMQVNYLGTVYAVKAVLPDMIKRRRGHVVLISSGAGVLGFFGYTSYCPTKFALRGLGQALHSELNPHGIDVSVVYPADVDTPQLAYELKIRPEEANRIAGQAKPVQPEVVARSILNGIRRRRFAISSNLEVWLLVRLSGLIEPIMNRYMGRVVAGVAKDRAAGKCK
jgi:3-dehydrosphinganine reductase